MSRQADDRRARQLSEAWYVRAASFDQKIADPEVREFLATHSWNDHNFSLQLKGLNRCLALGHELGLDWSYDWVLSRHAYDFTTEPVYQYLILYSLIGMWKDLPPGSRAPELLSAISARQTDGWVFSQARAEPVGAAVDIGWVQVPFAWDDFLKTAIDGWLAAADVDRQLPLSAICSVMASKTVTDLDFTAAIPYWRSLIAKSLAGTPSLKVRHLHESEWVTHLCRRHPLLQTEILHQQSFPAPDTGLTLAHLAMAYTVAHETAHIIQERCGQAFSDGVVGAADRERDADLRAMGALWNAPDALRSEERAGQPFQQLWFSSGLMFHVGLLISANVRRPVEAHVLQRGEVAQSLAAQARERLSAWGHLASRLADSLARQGDTEVAGNFQQVIGLLPSLVAYCNALLDFGNATVPAAIDEAEVLRREFVEATARQELDRTGRSQT